MAAIGVITVSDRVSKQQYEDKGGPAAVAFLSEKLSFNDADGSSKLALHTAVVPDEAEKLTEAVVKMTEELNCCLIVTTGGTGISARDITPQTTESLCAGALIPGFGERMRQASWESGVKTSMLSRATAGVFRGKCLIINVPGSPAAVDCCLSSILATIPHAVHQIGGPRLQLTDTSIDPALHHAQAHHHAH
eukprot:CAMPEP_0185832364 /NCGR_PEP_ID=MMETSP1353-20130828/2040_1 /TAXON_ID=1077150 /ORGANISM="Erythrolobus australicus, Strain CCMP3124" /LENGTH=191 /DNA_ID=CAMNT_0028530531 /DNA_START=94 /DNA_END=669 /DNA_ORIENTATION=+